MDIEFDNCFTGAHLSQMNSTARAEAMLFLANLIHNCESKYHETSQKHSTNYLWFVWTLWPQHAFKVSPWTGAQINEKYHWFIFKLFHKCRKLLPGSQSLFDQVIITAVVVTFSCRTISLSPAPSSPKKRNHLSLHNHITLHLDITTLAAKSPQSPLHCIFTSRTISLSSASSPI